MSIQLNLYYTVYVRYTHTRAPLATQFFTCLLRLQSWWDTHQTVILIDWENFEHKMSPVWLRFSFVKGRVLGNSPIV